MMNMQTTIEYKGIAGMGRREFNEYFMTPAMAEAGHHWAQKIVPKHFTYAAKSEYNYLPRRGESGSGRGFKNSYTAKKLAKFGHTLPLVYSGELRESTRVYRVRATSKSVTVTLPDARKANWRHPNSKIDMAAELSAVSGLDLDVLTNVINAKLKYLIDHYHGRKAKAAA